MPTEELMWMPHKHPITNRDNAIDLLNPLFPPQGLCRTVRRLRPLGLSRRDDEIAVMASEAVSQGPQIPPVHCQRRQASE